MAEVSIQIGYGQDATRLIDEASDEWVWTRLYELRSSGLASRLKFRYRSGNCLLQLQTPRAGAGSVRKIVDPDEFSSDILRLWAKQGLETPDFSAGAAVLFLRRVRKLYFALAA